MPKDTLLDRRVVADGASPQAIKYVDADVHPVVPRSKLLARLPTQWRSHVERYGGRMPYLGDLYPRAANQGMRADAWPEGDEAYPGTDPELARTQLLDEYGVSYAILNSVDVMMVYESPELSSAVARAVNDHLQEEWLDLDPRYLGAIAVPLESPAAAVAEIERRAGDERWVQVIVPASSLEPLGSRKYRPIFAAAAEAGLPVAMHLGGYDPHRGTGWPSYYIEEHVAYALGMESQLLNMVCDGLFAELPDLRVVVTECGVAWVVALRWALDGTWERMRGDLPHLDRRPSEIIHDHVWFTTQPIEEPDAPEHFEQALRHGRLTDRLLFSTDYPHWDFDSPTQALPRTLSKELRAQILHGNACALYDLPRRGS
jgi:predicted TIM-barrel fold metal-dependent hydrolase